MASLVGPIAYTRSESTPNFQVTISRQFEAADHLEATSPIAAGRRGKTGPPQRIGDPHSSVSLRGGHVSSPFSFHRLSPGAHSRAFLRTVLRQWPPRET